MALICNIRTGWEQAPAYEREQRAGPANVYRLILTALLYLGREGLSEAVRGSPRSSLT